MSYKKPPEPYTSDWLFFVHKGYTRWDRKPTIAKPPDGPAYEMSREEWDKLYYFDVREGHNSYMMLHIGESEDDEYRVYRLATKEEYMEENRRMRETKRGQQSVTREINARQRMARFGYGSEVLQQRPWFDSERQRIKKLRKYGKMGMEKSHNYTLLLNNREFGRWLQIYGGINAIYEIPVWIAEPHVIDDTLRYVKKMDPPFPQNDANAVIEDEHGNVIAILYFWLTSPHDGQNYIKLFGIRTIPMGKGLGRKVVEFILYDLGLSIKGDSVYQAVEFWDRMGAEWDVRKPDVTKDDANQNTRFFLRSPRDHQ